MRACRIFVISELIVVKEVFGLGMVVHRLTFVDTRVFEVLLIVFHDARHKFKESVPDSNRIYLIVLFIRVDHDPHESVIDHFKVWVRALIDTASCFHELLLQCLELACRKLARGCCGLLRLNIRPV